MRNRFCKLLVLNIVLFFSSLTLVCGQEKQIDSLQSVLKQKDLEDLDRGVVAQNIGDLYYSLSDFENARDYYNQALELYSKANHGIKKVGVLVALGIIHEAHNDFDKALSYYYNSLSVLDSNETDLTKEKYKLYRAVILLDISIVFGEVKYYDSALKYGLEGYEAIEKSDSMRQAVSLLNIGAIYLGLRQPQRALQYFEKSLKYFGEQEKEGSRTSAGVYTNMANAYFELNQRETALEYYTKALQFYESKSEQYKSDEAGVKAYIARLYAEGGDMINAKEMAYQALSLSQTEKGNDFSEGVYETLVEFYTASGNSDKAFESLSRLNAIRDSIYNPEVLSQISVLQQEYDQKILEEQNQMKIQLVQQKELIGRYKWYALTALLLILFLALLLIYSRLRHRAKLNKIELENSKKEQSKLTEQVTFKNKELTNFATYIVWRNEFLDDLKNKISKLKTRDDVKENVSGLTSMINQHISTANERKDFEVRIEEEYANFFYKLQSQYPSLTEKDRKLCSFLLLDLSSKEIASILNIASSSVDKSRHRLRKKLELDSDIELSTFLKDL